jgi:hypothetical protein
MLGNQAFLEVIYFPALAGIKGNTFQITIISDNVVLFQGKKQ